MHVRVVVLRRVAAGLPAEKHVQEPATEPATEPHRTRSHRTECHRTKSCRTESHRTESDTTKCDRTQSHSTKSHRTKYQRSDGTKSRRHTHGHGGCSPAQPRGGARCRSARSGVCTCCRRTARRGTTGNGHRRHCRRPGPRTCRSTHRSSRPARRPPRSSRTRRCSSRRRPSGGGTSGASSGGLQTAAGESRYDRDSNSTLSRALCWRTNKPNTERTFHRNSTKKRKATSADSGGSRGTSYI